MTIAEHHDTIVIGAGQAGLATGYHLARRGVDFVILESHDRVGDVWRNRFDSLKLYSPAQYDGLPGMPMPMPRWTWPGKHEMADYLEAYAARFELPVRTGIQVDGLAKAGDEYIVSAGDTVLTASNVVIATGGWQTPVVPAFADQLDPSIVQLHSQRVPQPDPAPARAGARRRVRTLRRGHRPGAGRDPRGLRVGTGPGRDPVRHREASGCG